MKFPNYRNVKAIHMVDGSVITPSTTDYLCISGTYNQDSGLGIIETDCIWKDRVYKPFDLTLIISSILLFELHN